MSTSTINSNFSQPELTSRYELFQSSDEVFWDTLAYGKSATVDDIRKVFAKGNHKHVYTFELPADDVEEQLEVVFAKSQNLDEDWNEESPCRSTSVGDIVRVGKDYWIVASLGFHLGWKD